MNETEKRDVSLKEFAEQIAQHEDVLFGMQLWRTTTPWLIRIFMVLSYRRGLEAMLSSIQQAKNLMLSAEKSNRPTVPLSEFTWPTVTPGIQQCTRLALLAYAQAFGNRPRLPLSKKELKKLQIILADIAWKERQQETAGDR